MFRSAKIRDKYLMTTEDGSWILLNKDEHEKMLSDKIEKESDLFNRLEEAGVIITDKNREKVIKRYQVRKEFLFQGPSLHIITPTLRCNQQCVYCQAGAQAHGEDMNEETARQIVDFIFQTPSNAIAIEFQGGEPLLAFDTIKMISEYTKEKNKKYRKNLKISVVTNLSLMNEETLDYLIKNGINICTSLDGPKEVHDRNRLMVGGAGTYDNVDKWLEKMRARNYIPGALPTVTRYSLPYPKEIVDEYVSHGIGSLHLRFMHRLGAAAKNWQEIGYTPEEFIKFWKTAMDYIIEMNRKGIKITERISYYILCKAFWGFEPRYNELQSPCGGIIGQLAYTPDGSVYTCDEGRMVGEPFRIGDVKTNTMREVTCSPQACSFVMVSTNDTLLCDACAWKPYCGVCPVCSYAEQGNIIPKLAMSDRCKIYRAIFEYVFEKYLFDDEARKVFDSWFTESRD